MLKVVLRSAASCFFFRSPKSSWVSVEKLFQARSIGTSAERMPTSWLSAFPCRCSCSPARSSSGSAAALHAAEWRAGVRERGVRGERGNRGSGGCRLGRRRRLDVGRTTRGDLGTGFDTQRRQLCLKLSQFMIPAGAILSLSALTAIVLNAHRRFVVPELGEVFRKLMLTIGFGFAVSRWGLEIIAPVFALGCLARLAVHIPPLLRTGVVANPFGPAHPVLRQAGLLTLPLAAGMFFSQLGE